MISLLIKSKAGMRFSNSFVVFVPGVMKCYNSRRHNASIREVAITGRAKISADVFDGDIRSAEIRLCTNIKPIGVFVVHFIFNFTKGWYQFRNRAVQAALCEKHYEESCNQSV